MSKIYISRTNRSDKLSFERLKNTLMISLGTDKVYYYQENEPSSVNVDDCQILVVIVSRITGHGLQGYIGRGVRTQIDRAIKNNMKVFLFDDFDNSIIPFDKVILTDGYHPMKNDMNNVAKLEWKQQDKHLVQTLVSLSLFMPYGVNEEFASSKNITTFKDFQTPVNSLLLRLR